MRPLATPLYYDYVRPLAEGEAWWRPVQSYAEAAVGLDPGASGSLYGPYVTGAHGEGQARVDEVKPLLQTIRELGGNRETACRREEAVHDRLNPDNPAPPLEEVAPW